MTRLAILRRFRDRTSGLYWGWFYFVLVVMVLSLLLALCAGCAWPGVDTHEHAPSAVSTNDYYHPPQ
jgi:hypothetical protein